MFGVSGRSVAGDIPLEISEEHRPISSSVRSLQDPNLGFAFSQEEGGVVSQSDLIRQYNSERSKPEGNWNFSTFFSLTVVFIYAYKQSVIVARSFVYAIHMCKSYTLSAYVLYWDA